MAISWSDAPHSFLPFIPLPKWRCPHCGSNEKPIHMRTRTERDRSIARRFICRECSKPSVIVLEPVDIAKVGNGESFEW